MGSNATTHQRKDAEEPRNNMATDRRNDPRQLSINRITDRRIDFEQLYGQMIIDQMNNDLDLWDDLEIFPEHPWGDATSTQEKCYDPQDATLTFVDGEDDLDFLCHGYKSLRAKMSCGHAVTPMSLTDWCRRQLDQGERRFVCGQTGCDVKWPFKEVCKMALLTPQEKKYFKMKLSTNKAKFNLNVKRCPGCKRHVKRTDPQDLCVECPGCSAGRGSPYKFCWQCSKRWSGPAPRSDRCENEDCQNPLEILKICPEITFKAMPRATRCPSIRACPTCGLLLEHNKIMCKNMTCPRCRVKFCFVCLKLTAECMKMTESSSYMVCSTGTAPRQTSIPVWQRS